MKRILPPRVSLILWPSLALLALMGLYRLFFIGQFHGLGLLREAGMGKALVLGLRFDLRMTALLALPALILLRLGSKPRPAMRAWAFPSQLAGLLLYAVTLFFVTSDVKRAKPWFAAFALVAVLDWIFLRGFGLRTHPSLRRLWAAYLALALATLLLAFGADLGAYAYTHTRLNGTLMEFLANPLLSARMVWETYPVLRALLGLAAALALALMGLGSLARRALKAPLPPRPGKRAVDLAFALLVVGALWGRASSYPLRWGDAYSLGNSFQAAAALNPMLFFLETKLSEGPGFDLAKVRASGPLLAKYLGAPEAPACAAEPSLRRTLEPRPQLPTGARPNLVFLHLESLAAYKMGIFGNPVKATPFLDGLLEESLFFDHFYVPVENTSRSMFAMFYGIPDVTPGNTATRNPMMVDQDTLLKALENYHRYYFLGGSGNWAQLRATLKNNIPGLETFERESFKSPEVDVWGLCDADLLRETQTRLDTLPQPFFALVQTAGNHPPFTIPRHLTGFKVENLDATRLEAGQFADNLDYNALRLLDYSLGLFFAQARKSPEFTNTIYVLYGDHGVARGSRDRRYGDISLAYHQVPFALYAPGFFPKGRRISQVASELDVLPTLMGMLGHRTEYQGLGRDLFDPRQAEGSAAFTFANFQNTPVMGLIQNGYYVNLGPGPKVGLFRLDDPQGLDLHALDPARTREMAALARAYYEWSRYLMSHNKPRR